MNDLPPLLQPPATLEPPPEVLDRVLLAVAREQTEAAGHEVPLAPRRAQVTLLTAACLLLLGLLTGFTTPKPRVSASQATQANCRSCHESPHPQLRSTSCAACHPATAP